MLGDPARDRIVAGDEAGSDERSMAGVPRVDLCTPHDRTLVFDKNAKIPSRPLAPDVLCNNDA